MSEEFFKRLRKKVLYDGPEEGARTLFPKGFSDGVNATIEALKEMMVGEPKDATVKHFTYRQDHRFGEKATHILTDASYPYNRIELCKGHINTDGEEVIVLAVRLS